MNSKLLFSFLTLLLIACNEDEQKNSSQKKNETQAPQIVIGKKIVTNEVAGSAYLKKAIEYFVITDKDTSGFICTFSESNKGEVSINMRFEKGTMTYRQRMEELKLILPNTSADFILDSLKSIFIGGLASNGDLAIEVTKQYRQKFGESNKITDYKTVEQFLKESKLGTDINSIFKPYSISVGNVSAEKIFFTTKQDFYSYNKIETDTANVPNQILNCIVWVNLSKK